MQFAKKAILFLFFISITSCSLAMLEGNEGIIWDYQLERPISQGVLLHENSLYAADEAGSIYSFWMDTGMIRWKRKLADEQIIGLTTGTNGLTVFSTHKNKSFIRIYSYDLGELIKEKDFSQIWNTGITTNSRGYILTSGNEVFQIDYNLGISSLGVYSNLGQIKAIIKAKQGYFLIDSATEIVFVSEDFKPLWSDKAAPGEEYFSSAYYTSGRLVFAAESGLIVYNDQTRQSKKISWVSGSGPLLSGNHSLESFISLAESDKDSSGNQNDGWDSTTGWYQTAFNSVTYSPIVISGGTPAVAAVDNKGYLAVIDRYTGQLLSSRFVGTLDKPGLTIASDYSGKAIFIPVTSPARLLCFSLDYAVKNRKKD